MLEWFEYLEMTLTSIETTLIESLHCMSDPKNYLESFHTKKNYFYESNTPLKMIRIIC